MIAVDENRGLFFLSGQMIEGLTLWLVGMIRPRAGRSAEPWSNVITTPTRLSVLGEIIHQAPSSMAAQEHHLPSYPGIPVLLRSTQEVATDAGRSVPESIIRACDNPTLGWFYVEGQLLSAALDHDFHYEDAVRLSDTEGGGEAVQLPVGSPPVSTENVESPGERRPATALDSPDPLVEAVVSTLIIWQANRGYICAFPVRRLYKEHIRYSDGTCLVL